MTTVQLLCEELLEDDDELNSSIVKSEEISVLPENEAEMQLKIDSVASIDLDQFNEPTSCHG